MPWRRTGAGLAALLVAAHAFPVSGRVEQREEAGREEVRALEAEVHGALGAALKDALPGHAFGMSAAFVLPDGRVGTAVSGFADAEDETRMAPEHRFMAGSLGKSFFAALALALDGDGTLDLDAPISRWLADAPWFARLPNAPDLTLRLLLQHRSGLVDHISTFEFMAKSLAKRLTGGREATMTPEELVEIALDRDPLFRAGEGFEYGDTNYVLAGLVIERATGRSAFDLVEERFLEPLQIEGVVIAREREIPNLCPGYQLPVNPFLLPRKIAKAGRLEVDPMVESTAGGMAMTPRGAARWAQRLFGGQPLDASYLEQLVGDTVEAGDGRRYGLGVFVYDTDLGTAWGHGGWFPGYRSELRYFQDSGLAVAVLVNRDHLVDVSGILMQVTRALRQAMDPTDGGPSGPARSGA